MAYERIPGPWPGNGPERVHQAIPLRRRQTGNNSSPGCITPVIISGSISGEQTNRRHDPWNVFGIIGPVV